MKNIIAAIMMILLSSYANAQDIKNDLLKMRKFYEQANSLSMNIEVKAYGNDGKEIYSDKGKVQKSGKLYYSDMTSRTMISNQKGVIVVDNNKKIILYTSSSSPGTDIPVDTVIPKDVKLRYVSKDGKQKRIEMIDPASPLYEKTEVIINARDNSLEGVVYYYKPKNESEEIAFKKVEIKYTGIEVNSSIPPSVFSEKEFVSEVKGKLVPSSKYSGYKLIDQRSGHSSVK